MFGIAACSAAFPFYTEWQHTAKRPRLKKVFAFSTFISHKKSRHCAGSLFAFSVPRYHMITR
jgi:hypothetical protein